MRARPQAPTVRNAALSRARVLASLERAVGRDLLKRIGLLAFAAAFVLLAVSVSFRPAPVHAATPFTDIGGSMFEDDIDWAFNESIAAGCTATTYCPNSPVTRGQMAAFIARMFQLPSTTNDYFSDDNGTGYEASINRVVRAGIASGCTATRYCPSRAVTRAEMTTFLSRALDLGTGGANNYFYDDNGSTHEISTNRAAFAGIATGCAQWKFCPGTAVTRGQMAAFLHRVVQPVPAPAFPAPPPPTPKPTPAPTAAPTPPGSGCHPSYTGGCLGQGIGDYDCIGGSGNGPNYTGLVQVVGYDEFALDADNDGWGCE